MAIRIGVQFGWSTQKTAYQNIKAQRTRIANYVSSSQATISAIGSSLTSAATSQISGMAQIAAQKAVTRLQAQIKAATASRDKQLADAQATLAATQTAYNSSALSAGDTSSAGNVLSTTA